MILILKKGFAIIMKVRNSKILTLSTADARTVLVLKNKIPSMVPGTVRVLYFTSTTIPY
jgi:hypothetical protein